MPLRQAQPGTQGGQRRDRALLQQVEHIHADRLGQVREGLRARLMPARLVEGDLHNQGADTAGRGDRVDLLGRLAAGLDPVQPLGHLTLAEPTPLAQPLQPLPVERVDPVPTHRHTLPPVVQARAVHCHALGRQRRLDDSLADGVLQRDHR
jgi:hypothetical protein